MDYTHDEDGEPICATRHLDTEVSEREKKILIYPHSLTHSLTRVPHKEFRRLQRAREAEGGGAWIEPAIRSKDLGRRGEVGASRKLHRKTGGLWKDTSQEHGRLSVAARRFILGCCTLVICVVGYNIFFGGGPVGHIGRKAIRVPTSSSSSSSSSGRKPAREPDSPWADERLRGPGEPAGEAGGRRRESLPLVPDSFGTDQERSLYSTSLALGRETLNSLGAFFKVSTA